MDLLYDPATGRIIALRSDAGALSFCQPVPRGIDVGQLAAIPYDGPRPVGARVNPETHALERNSGYRPPPGFCVDEASWQLVRGT